MTLSGQKKHWPSFSSRPESQQVWVCLKVSINWGIALVPPQHTPLNQALRNCPDLDTARAFGYFSSRYIVLLGIDCGFRLVDVLP